MQSTNTEVYKRHKHIPFLAVDGADLRNTCGICGEGIERSDPYDGNAWCTAAEADAYHAELESEARREQEEADDHDYYGHHRNPGAF